MIMLQVVSSKVLAVYDLTAFCILSGMLKKNPVKIHFYYRLMYGH